MTTIPRLYAVALAIAMTSWSGSVLGGDCCSHCGCQDGSQKVCRLVCEEKKVKVVCWGCKCEDFCVPGKSCRGDKNCEMVCADCNSCSCNCEQPSAKPKKFVWYNWEAGCGHMDTKKKLMKKEVTVTVPSFKWVVEDLCGSCEAKCGAAALPSNVPMPPMPPAASQAKLKYYTTAEEVLTEQSVQAQVQAQAQTQGQVQPVSVNLYQKVLTSLKAK
jgi:hypothetical protein